VADPADPAERAAARRIEGVRRAAIWIGPSLLAIVLFIALTLLAPRVTDHLVEPAGGDVEGLQLKTLIRQVKKELQDADLEAVRSNEPALFELKQFDLDVNIVASGKTAADAKVLAVGSNVEVSRERVQHIHLVWTAARPEAVIVQPHEIKGNATDVIDMEPIQQGGPKQ